MLIDQIIPTIQNLFSNDFDHVFQYRAYFGLGVFWMKIVGLNIPEQTD